MLQQVETSVAYCNERISVHDAIHVNEIIKGATINHIARMQLNRMAEATRDLSAYVAQAANIQVL